MICPLKEQACLNPDAVVLTAGELIWTYKTLDERAQSLACGLLHQGLKTGDVLLISSPNSPMLVALLFACLRTGIIVLPVNPRFPVQQVFAIAGLVGVQGVWSDQPGFFDAAFSDWSGIYLPQNLRDLEISGSDSLSESFVVPEWDDQRICNLVLTSGSSGLPKAVAHCFAAHRASAVGSQEVIPLRPGHGWLLSLPLYHVGGQATLFRCVMAGAQAIFPDHGVDLADTLYRRAVTHVSMVNTQLYRLLSHPGFHINRTSVELLLMGGGFVSAQLAQECDSQGVRVLTSYGMSEMGSQICTGRPQFLPDGSLTSGSPLSGTSVRITDDSVIEVRGQTLFAGYWKHGQLTLSLTEDGWFKTGDRGCWHKPGTNEQQIQVLGRVDCQFVSGGENIQPESIERILLHIPDIMQAVVVPITDSEYGERPVAIVDCGTVPFNPLNWEAHLRKYLPGFMIPDHFIPWSSLESDIGLKVDRRKLAAFAENILIQAG